MLYFYLSLIAYLLVQEHPMWQIIGLHEFLWDSSGQHWESMLMLFRPCVLAHAMSGLTDLFSVTIEDCSYRLQLLIGLAYEDYSYSGSRLEDLLLQTVASNHYHLIFVLDFIASQHS